MLEAIGIVIIVVLSLFVWIVMGKRIPNDDVEVDKITINVLEDVVKKLQSENKELRKYAPVLEKNKSYVIAMYRKGMSQVEIANRIGSFQSQVSRYLRKRGEIK